MHRRTSLLFLVFAALVPSRVVAQIAHPDTTITPDVQVINERFGQSIDVDGDRMIVGAPQNDEQVIFGGLAYVFERAPDGSWDQVAKLVPPIPLFPLASVGQRVAIDGSRALVSSFNDWVVAYEIGPSGNWLFDAFLFAPAFDDDGFGTSLALEGNRAVVATTGSGTFGFGPGKLYVFERSAGAWTLDATIVGPTAGIDDGFGNSIALRGDFVAVGAARDVLSPVADAGVVHLARRNGPGDWSIFDSITEPVPEIGAEFGTAVALDDTRLFVGAVRGDAAAVDGGEVHQFEFAGGTFVHVREIAASTLQPGDRFGGSLDASGGTLLIGAEEAVGANSVNGGAAFLFRERGDGTWSEVARIEMENPAVLDDLGSFRGTPIAVEGDALLLGVPGADGEGAVVELLNGELLHGDTSIAAATGGAQTLSLRTGEDRTGDAYFVVGSVTGTAPGIDLGLGATLPIVFDAYSLLTVELAAPIVAPLGVLGPDGEAEASFVVSSSIATAFAGTTLFHAAVTIDLTSFEVDATNAVAVTLVP